MTQKELTPGSYKAVASKVISGNSTKGKPYLGIRFVTPTGRWVDSKIWIASGIGRLLSSQIYQLLEGCLGETYDIVVGESKIYSSTFIDVVSAKLVE